MHSYHGDTHYFHYNGDFSGEVIINQKDSYHPVEVESEDLINICREVKKNKNTTAVFEGISYNYAFSTSDDGIVSVYDKETNEILSDFAIPIKEIKELVAYYYVRDIQISKLERLTPDELLNLL